MAPKPSGTDVVYLAACARDARLTRICVASIRYFYPDVPIKILAGDILQRGLAQELKKNWNVGLAGLPEGDYGWGFVKLEPLFASPPHRFLVCDVDTVFTGRILDVRAQSQAPFFVDDEKLSDADFKRLYYDWEAVGRLDPDTQSARKAFNVGQWFGTSGLVDRAEFDQFLSWNLPRVLRRPDLFMGGDQGVMNHVILKKEALQGLAIARHTFMRWPGHGMSDLSVDAVASGRAPPLIIHWAGMKAILLKNMVGHELLTFFEKYYYTRAPLGSAQRWIDIAYHIWLNASFKALRPLRLRWQRLKSMLGRQNQPSAEVKVDLAA